MVLNDIISESLSSDSSSSTSSASSSSSSSSALSDTSIETGSKLVKKKKQKDIMLNLIRDQTNRKKNNRSHSKPSKNVIIIKTNTSEGNLKNNDYIQNFLNKFFE